MKLKSLAILLLWGSALGQNVQVLKHKTPPAIPALIAEAGCYNGTHTCTTAALNTTGATLLVFTEWGDTASTLTASTASPSNTATGRTAVTNSTITARVLYVFNPNVGASQTFTCDNTTGTYVICQASAWSNTLTTSSVYDTESGATGLANCPVSPTTTQANELVITVYGTSNGGSDPTIDTGFTVFGTSGNPDRFAAYLVAPTAGPLGASWHYSIGASSACPSAAFLHP